MTNPSTTKLSTTREIGTEEAMAGAVEAEQRDERKVASVVHPLPNAEESGAEHGRKGEDSVQAAP